ncbi:protein PIMREG isoform X6 [Sminthopsis crassicaudata]|uniref:protein PIMREG isoform X6 n=1 Tax=Sminthopsis crassicaudata TaxID=9301 RepID=UPI003D697176
MAAEDSSRRVPIDQWGGQERGPGGGALDQWAVVLGPAASLNLVGHGIGLRAGGRARGREVQAAAGMTSVWPGVARGRRSHRMLTEEKGSPSPGRRKPRSGSLRSRLSRRLPLGVLDVNFGDGPSWEPLESPERVRVAAGSARRALGSVAQKIQKSCQGSGLRRDPGRAPAGSPHPSSRRRSARRPLATPPCQGSGLRRLSTWITKDPLRPLRRRSQRAAALLSPYSSPAPLCPTRGGCQEEEEEEEMESVAAGIEQLKQLSEAFDEAIAADESDLTVALVQP